MCYRMVRGTQPTAVVAAEKVIYSVCSQVVSGEVGKTLYIQIKIIQFDEDAQQSLCEFSKRFDTFTDTVITRNLEH